MSIFCVNVVNLIIFINLSLTLRMPIFALSNTNRNRHKLTIGHVFNLLSYVALGKFSLIGSKYFTFCGTHLQGDFSLLYLH